MIKSEFIFELKKSKIEYALKGDKIVARNLLLKAPSMKTKNYALKLKQFFTQAILAYSSTLKTTNQSVQTGGDEMDGKGCLTIILGSNVDIDSLIDTFQKLLLDVCLVDGDVLILPHMINQMDEQEFEDLLGEYYANFIAPSLIANSN